MRKMLDVHHIVFRSHGGSDEPENLVCLCRPHHALIHRGICSASGRVGVDLKFERPRLASERVPEPMPMPKPAGSPAPVDPSQDVLDEDASAAGSDDDEEAWREAAVAEIVEGPPSPRAPRPDTDYADWLVKWIDENAARGFHERSRKRKRRASRHHDPSSGAHVCVETPGTDRSPERREKSRPRRRVRARAPGERPRARFSSCLHGRREFPSRALGFGG